MSWHFLFAMAPAATLSDLPSQLSLPKGSGAQTVRLWEAGGCQTLKQSSPHRGLSPLGRLSTGHPQTLPTCRLRTASWGIPALWGLRALKISGVRDRLKPPPQEALPVTISQRPHQQGCFPEPEKGAPLTPCLFPAYPSKPGPPSPSDMTGSLRGSSPGTWDTADLLHTLP